MLEATRLSEQLTSSVNKAQRRKRSRLVDQDDIGEFINEIIELRKYFGLQLLIGTMACPSTLAYKGRRNSTVLYYRKNEDGSEEVWAQREERINSYRFKAYLPHTSEIPPVSYNRQRTD